jgi:hypothetical protein
MEYAKTDSGCTLMPEYVDQFVDQYLRGQTLDVALVEAFSISKNFKQKVQDFIDIFDYYRLGTNLKGKKTYGVKKNIPCQTFETMAEASRMFEQTRANFDFFLHKVLFSL